MPPDRMDDARTIYCSVLRCSACGIIRFGRRVHVGAGSPHARERTQDHRSLPIIRRGVPGAIVWREAPTLVRMRGAVSKGVPRAAAAADYADRTMQELHEDDV